MSRTPMKVVIEITPKGWTTKVTAADGTELSNREMRLTSYGAHGVGPGDIFDDLGDDELSDLAEAIDARDHHETADILRNLDEEQ